MVINTNVELVGTNDNHIVCLHNPIDIDTINLRIKDKNPYPQDDTIKYLFVGNYSIHKAHDVLIEAFRIVRSHKLNKYPSILSTLFGMVMVSRLVQLEKELVRLFRFSGRTISFNNGQPLKSPI